LNAAKVCRIGGCDAAAWKAYRSDLFWYLSARLQHLRLLDMKYGDPGIRRAQSIYDSPSDRQIEQDLRDRYRAGVFRLKDLGQNRDAISILVLAGSRALKPCRRAGLSG
jgi:hypothetical protein